MEFKELTDRVFANAKKYEKNYGVKIDLNFSYLKLMEEMGEFAEAILIHTGQCRPEKILPPDTSKEKVAQELADVIGMAIVLACLLDIDLEQALDRKWITKKT